MTSRELPSRADLDHLKAEAKALLRSAQRQDPDALARAAAVLGEAALTKLTDAQRVIAREYGFPTWARLRGHVRAARIRTDPLDTILSAVHAGDAGELRRAIDASPDVASESLHVAAVLGRVADVERLLAAHPDQLQQRRGTPSGDPLLYLCYSPLHHESAERDAALLRCAELLLAAGADPNTRDGRFNVPALFAVTAERSVLAIAKLLLAAGASPNDSESLFHSAERGRIDSLELLLAAGADVNHGDDTTALYFLVRWYDVLKHPRVHEGVEWLFAHGADPNVRCGAARETVMHLAARRRQQPAFVRELVDHGADVNARRADGATPWLLAQRFGNEQVATLLEELGAGRAELTQMDQLLGACGRGDVDAARRLSEAGGGPRGLVQQLELEGRRLLPQAAAADHVQVVLACLAAGFPVNTTDEDGATALHHCAIHGRAELVRALLDKGASTNIMDKSHKSTPLGWACFGADFWLESTGDYIETVRALVASGARPHDDEYRSRRPEVRAVLEAEIIARP